MGQERAAVARGGRASAATRPVPRAPARAPPGRRPGPHARGDFARVTFYTYQSIDHIHFYALSIAVYRVPLVSSTRPLQLYLSLQYLLQSFLAIAFQTSELRAHTGDSAFILAFVFHRRYQSVLIFV